jgi:hypothetical protein
MPFAHMVDFVRCLEGKPLAGADTLLAVPDRQREAAAEVLPIPSRLRKLQIAERPAPEPPKPPRPRRRERIPTDQPCSIEESAFKALIRAGVAPNTS